MNLVYFLSSPDFAAQLYIIPRNGNLWLSKGVLYFFQTVFTSKYRETVQMSSSSTFVTSKLKHVGNGLSVFSEVPACSPMRKVRKGSQPWSASRGSGDQTSYCSASATSNSEKPCISDDVAQGKLHWGVFTSSRGVKVEMSRQEFLPLTRAYLYRKSLNSLLLRPYKFVY